MITQSRVKTNELIKYNLQTEDNIKVCDKKIKTIHEEGWNIDEYCKIFEIPKETQVEIKDWLFSVINDFDSDIIRILCPGVGGGRNELYMISVLADKYSDSRIVCDFIDYSKDSCDYLKGKILPEKGYIVDLSGWKFCKDNIEINIYEEDYESWLNSVSNVDDKYNLILSFFLFNFLSNWRESILKTVELLDEDGVLVVSQDLGDICYLDNTCYDVPEKNDSLRRHYFYDLWNDYYDLRNKYGLDWNNLISPSNMIFVDNVFKDISRITNNYIYNSKDFLWKLSDLSDESQYKFVKLNTWIEMIKGKDESDIIFNCLSIPDNIRDDIANILTDKYSNKEVIDLKLGEKLFALKRPSGVSNFVDICRCILEKNYLNIQLLGAYRFKNRYDVKVEGGIKKIDIKNSLLNRALDIYNCYIHDKSKAMVSLFSKKVERKGFGFEYTWRKFDTPIIYPFDYDKNDVRNFAISYAAYFYYRKNRKDYAGRITSIVHDKFPNRVGLIFNIKDEIENIDIEPIFYRNNKEVKAFLVTISRERFRECQIKFKKIINSLSDKIKNDIIKGCLNDISDKKNYIDTKVVVSIAENMGEYAEKFDYINRYFECKDIKFIEKVKISIGRYCDDNELTQESKKEIVGEIVNFFKYIYIIALSHPVDSNIIMYTTTNIDLDFDDDGVKREKSYYGLIIADSIYNKDVEYISAYYDLLLANTFSYSGMDGMHELKVKDLMIRKIGIRNAVTSVMSRNMSHNIGSHVLASMSSSESILKIAESNEHNQRDNNYLYKDDDTNRSIVINKNSESIDLAIAKFNSYLKTRMDYLADIATANQIITVKNNLSKDVVEVIDSAQVLIKKHITGNNKIFYISQNPVSNFYADMPNGALGMHAFYIIIENIVRNSAKHGNGDKIEVKFTECGKNNFNDQNNDLPNIRKIIIYDASDYKDEKELISLEDEQNKRIDKKILDNNGVLRKGSWGLLEMKISAAYLRKISLDKIDDKDITPPLLKAVKVDGKYLGYEIYLLKPKTVVVIYDNDFKSKIQSYLSSKKLKENEFWESELKKWSSEGVDFVHVDKFKNNDDSYTHDILLLLSVDYEMVSDKLNSIPMRIVAATYDECKELIINTDVEVFIEKIWDKWCKNIIAKYGNVDIVFSDESEKNVINRKKYTVNGQDELIDAIFIRHCKEVPNNYMYFEQWGSLHPAHYMIDEFVDNEEKKKESIAKFIESIIFKIAIVDERIQIHSLNEYDGGIKGEKKNYYYFMQKCGLVIPPEEINLNIEEFDESVKKSVIIWIEKQINVVNFLIIHIGVIEKICSLAYISDEQKKDEINKFLIRLKGINNGKTKIVISSGRGQPEGVPDGVLFVQYSNVSQYIVESSSKYHFTQMLMSTRGIKNNGYG